MSLLGAATSCNHGVRWLKIAVRPNSVEKSNPNLLGVNFIGIHSGSQNLFGGQSSDKFADYWVPLSAMAALYYWVPLSAMATLWFLVGTR